MNWLDVIGQATLGVGSVIALIYLYRHVESFSDGNVGGEE